MFVNQYLNVDFVVAPLNSGKREKSIFSTTLMLKEEQLGTCVSGENRGTTMIRTSILVMKIQDALARVLALKTLQTI